MRGVVSKVRAKKTKTREKVAGKAAARRLPIGQRPSVGIVIAIGLWILTVAIAGLENIVTRRADIGCLFALTGDGVFLLVSLCVTGLLLQRVRPEAMRSNPRILLLSLVSLFSIIPAKILLYAAHVSGVIPIEMVDFLLPFALAPLLATILIDSTTGIVVGLWTSLAVAVLAGRSFPTLLLALVATLVTAEAAHHVRTRSRVFRIGIVVGLSEVTCVLAITALNWESTAAGQVFQNAGACLLSGLLSAIGVLIILPLFEGLFHITTDITLLELSDLGHPLLQRLAIEAPGTYHHSLVVANLAQAAADEIGANSLLARVCSYFHDVGKLTKPGFFSENINQQSNPHDELPPSMSTLVITAHVKEGLSLALLHKLPPPILNAIREHHGTTVLSCFHHKASTQTPPANAVQAGPGANDQAKVNEQDFRYTGPKPSSRESAIICLADAVEAASRSLEKVTPTHIRNLVDDITNKRLQDGQLDHADVTLAELGRIKRSFVFTLTNMLHARVAYPKDESRDQQQAKARPAENAENR